MKLPKIPKNDMMKKAERIAKNLYRQYSIEEKDGRDCGDLLLEWIKENFWGIIVSKHIPTFERVWKMLDEKRHTKNNKFIYGDIDQGLWIEYPKDKNKKVIISTCYCSCADDNTHIFILERLYSNRIRFRVATVWPREKHNTDGRWGDDRDIDIPSLNTYRKRDFRYGYYDCRDEGHCILYENYERKVGRVEKAHWGEGKIKHALWTLRMHLEALEEEKK